MPLSDSDSEVILLHNPRCSKSRATAGLLAEAGIVFTERRYLEEPLTVTELQELRRRLDRPVREWIRTGEGAFAAAGLEAGSDEAQLLEAMAREPILMERPIVVRGDRARVGRPPTEVLELFEE